MHFFSVEGNRFYLDGGAMFGNCPRSVWEKWCVPDADNRIDLASRALLVREPSGRQVLCETGIGAFFDPKQRERYGVRENEHVLLRSLAALEVKPEAIDVVVLSHLHFDHAGGLLSAYQPDEKARLVFPNARFIVSRGSWERFVKPHIRDQASFIPELRELLLDSGRLEIVQSSRSFTLGAAYSFSFSDGHTPGMMMTRIESESPGPITVVSDLIPGVAWLHLPITTGYDRFPELLVDEKMRFLEKIAESDERVFYTHDPRIAVSRIAYDDQGRFVARDPQDSI
jgi:glyoxylase-like metal-dependent hydrolase (beta-lactamase superfamily II)